MTARQLDQIEQAMVWQMVDTLAATYPEIPDVPELALNPPVRIWEEVGIHLRARRQDRGPLAQWLGWMDFLDAHLWEQRALSKEEQRSSETRSPLMSFAEAGTCDPSGGEAYGVFRQLPGRPRVHVLVDGRWRAYALIELDMKVSCSHCGQALSRGQKIFRYGTRAFLWCCLDCVQWHLADSCTGHRRVEVTA